MNGVLIGGGMGKLIGRWIGNRRIKKRRRRKTDVMNKEVEINHTG